MVRDITGEIVREITAEIMRDITGEIVSEGSPIRNYGWNRR